MKSGAFKGICIFLLSGAALAYEVILVRLLAMTRFHHLAFMVLSLALLGYGVSGVLLARFRNYLLDSFRWWFCAFAALFAMGAVLCFQLSQRIPVFPAQWLWSPFEAFYLAALYLVLALPFLAAACGVGLAYCAVENTAGFVYRADLLGAAAGSLGALAVLWLPAAQGLWVPWSAGLVAAALMVLPVRKWLAGAALLLAAAGPVANLQPAVGLIISPDKPLSIALSAEGAQKLSDVFTPLGRITVTENTLAPYRQAPGLSLAFRGKVEGQRGVFTDGEAFQPLPAAPQPNHPPAYLDFLPEALAYTLQSPQRVLMLDASLAENLAHAVTRGVQQVDVVLSNPGWRTVLENSQSGWAGGYLASGQVHLTIGSPRGFLRRGERLYDLIVLGQPGPSSLTADHLHTVEAFEEALKRLAPGGLLAVGGPSDLPPRTGLRLLNTAAAALEMSGLQNAGAQLTLIRSLRTVHLLVKNGPLTGKEIAKIRAFCGERLFDPVWFPGIEAGEANRWNRLDTPLFYQGAVQLLGPEEGRFEQRYKFDLSPVFDDRPYFSRFIKLATLKELFSLRGSGALGLLSLAEPVLAATLAQAVLLSLLLVWLPLRRFRARAKGRPRGAIYLMLGTGFMLAEFAMIEKMSLFLNEPVAAVAVTLAAFLAMAGLGGGISSRLIAGNGKALQYTGLAAVLVTGVLVVYLTALPAVLTVLIGMPLAVRMALALLLMAPLALAMGLPFPLAVAVLKGTEAPAVPWAWGLNGCGSLIGPVLGISLAVYGGVTAVLWGAVFCYVGVFAGTLGRGAR